MKEKKEKLNNSQVKVMQLLWETGATTAKNLCLMAAERYDWNKNTTYTIIKSLVEMGAVERSEPDFLCTPVLSLEEVRRTETKGLVDKFFHGSASAFFSAFLEDESISSEELEALKKIINEKK
ncbi:MAG: BlaI/MecI/CopY family transcriptional regulator [Oscillospiraceae bacterium]|nr:BlaI/MecI/CopY family transcriptional regulator [Oscillospiraceae bacterium]MBQ5322116.1 BlaI/MecI/CopY family transcriptional regulator [Oscillospiraceae bacterium]MBQ8594968.1 BlaI/MecI/CopY family transcriptional regulator [Oscillospiraceae bacterium]